MRGNLACRITQISPGPTCAAWNAFGCLPQKHCDCCAPSLYALSHSRRPASGVGAVDTNAAATGVASLRQRVAPPPRSTLPPRRMSQQYEYPPPPPPRSPASLAAASGASVPEVRRRAPPAQPPSLATNLGRPLGQAGQPSYTPISAATLAPGSPYPFTPATPLQLPPRPHSLLVPPGSPMVPPRSPSMEPYNPRQWSSRQPVSGSQMVFSQRGAHAGPSNTRETTGMEGSSLLANIPYLIT